MPILFPTVFSAVQRRLLLFVGHLGLAALSNWVGLLLRFD